MKPFRPAAAVLLIAAIACLHVQAFDLHVHEAAGDSDHHHAPAIHQHDAVHDVARDVPEIEAVDGSETVISVGVFLSPAQDAAPLPGLCAAAPALATASPRAASSSAVAARAHGPPCADRRLSRGPPQSSSL